MTNAEKFKEVFGFYPDAYEDESVCNMMRCEDASCKDCPYCVYYDEDEDGHNDIHAKWTDEYIGPYEEVKK